MALSCEQLFEIIKPEIARMDKIRENNPHVLMSDTALGIGQIDGTYRSRVSHTAFSWYFQLILSAFFPTGCTGVHLDMSSFFHESLSFSSRAKAVIKDELKQFFSFVGNETDTNMAGYFRNTYNTPWRRVFNVESEKGFIKVFPVKVNKETLTILIEQIIPENPEKFMVIKNEESTDFYGSKEPFKVFYYNPTTRTFLGFYYKKSTLGTDIVQGDSHTAMIPRFYQILSGFLINQGIKDKDPRYADLDKFKKEYAKEIEILNKYGSLSLYETYYRTYFETVRNQPAISTITDLINQIKGFLPTLPEYLEKWKGVLKRTDEEQHLRSKVKACDEQLSASMNEVLRRQRMYEDAMLELNNFLTRPKDTSAEKKAMAVYQLLTTCKNIIRFIPNDMGVNIEILQDMHFGNDREFIKIFSPGNQKYKNSSEDEKKVIDAMLKFMVNPNSRFAFVGFSAFNIRFDSVYLPNTRNYIDKINRSKYPGNPHFTVHNCFGTFGTTITQCFKNKDYETAIQLMLEAASGLNSYEVFTVECYIKDCVICMRRNLPFIRDLQTEELISIDEAYKRAEEEKTSKATAKTKPAKDTEAERKSLAN